MEIADPEEVTEFAAALSESFLLCRDLGHNWRPLAAHWNPDEHSYSRVLRCVRCRTNREQTLSDTGSVLSSGYEYPDGYQHKGLGRIDGAGRDRLRIESVTRAIRK